MLVHDTFELGLDPRWQQTQQGQGQIVRRPGTLHLTLLPADDPATYSNAQISEYTPAHKNFQCAPPLRLTVRAFSSLHPRHLVGTAGFGFWNHPFEPGQRLIGRPQAAWFFFGAPPNNMALALDQPGHGWKAATFDARRPLFALLAPFAPLGVLLMRVPALYRRLWPLAQRALGISEAPLELELLNSEHEYRLDWRPDGVTFALDGQVIHHAPYAPRGPLGFVCWIDNQYQIVTPQGQLSGGVTPVARPQSLVLTEIKIEPLA